jgi:hypothetical protein
MKTAARILIGLAISVTPLLTSAALAQRTGSDYSSQQPFGAPRTFTFKQSAGPETTTEKTSLYDSPFVKERTEAAIAAQLERRGWTRNDKTPDVIVSATRTFRKDYTVYNSGWGPYWGGPYGWGGYGWWGYWDGWPGWNSWYTVEEITGILTVDLEDAETGQLLWRGVGEKEVHNHKSLEHRVEHVNDEVTDVFKKFPR